MATALTGARYKNVLVSGANLSINLLEAVESMGVELSNSAVSSLKLTFLDTPDLSIYRSNVVNPGQTVTYEGFTFEVMESQIDPGSIGPKVTLPCVSKRVTALTRQVGARSWGTTDVSAWVKGAAQSVGFAALVQPGLGRQLIAREKPDGDRAQSTWDIMASLKDELGVWLYEYGNLLVFAKPTWLDKRPGAPVWRFTWNSMADHSETLLAAPEYRRRPTAERDEREAMTIRFTGADASKARPGDFVELSTKLTGATFKGRWIVRSVDVGGTVNDPVVLECGRVVDPVPRPKDTPAAAAASTSGQLANNPQGKVAGYSGTQITNARLIINAGLSLGVSRHGQTIAVMTAMGESSLINVNRGDAAGPDSRGLFQQRDNGAWGTLSDRMNPGRAATSFYKALLKVPGWESMTPTAAAHAVQRNADPNHYAQFFAPAEQVVAAIYAANPSGGTSSAIGGKAQAWINSVKGSFIDFDGAAGAQCVDVFKKYNAEVVGGPSVLGNGKDFYNHAALAGKYVRLNRNTQPLLGDVACWGPGEYGGKYGHVAIVVADKGGAISVLSQNPGPAQIMNLSKAGLQGYLRPKG